MENIRSLPVAKPVNSDVVEKIEAMLAQARDGEVESFIAAVFRPNHRWHTTFSGQINTVEKIGALEAMKLDLLNSIDDS